MDDKLVDKTIPDEFLKIIKDFVRDITSTFPEYKTFVDKWWKNEDDPEKNKNSLNLYSVEDLFQNDFKNISDEEKLDEDNTVANKINMRVQFDSNKNTLILAPFSYLSDVFHHI